MGAVPDPTLSRRWHAGVDAHPVDGPAWMAAAAVAGAVYAGRPLAVHRTPVWLAPAELPAWARRLARFHRVVRVVRARLLDDLARDDHRLCARIGVPPLHRRWARLDPGYASAAPLARLDTFTGAGDPAFLELNAEAPAGMGYATALAERYRDDPAAPRFRHLDPIPALARTLLGIAREAGLRARAPRTVVVDLPGGGTAPELALIARRLGDHGLPAAVADPGDLRFDGDRLTLGGAPVDLVYRRILVVEIAEHAERCRALLDAYAARRVVMVNPLRTALLHNKGLFALLHDPEVLPDPADRRFVARFVPWTGLLVGDGDPGLRDRVRRAPDDWVLKPVDLHGGTGVVIGRRVGRAAWERAVDAARHHVVQRWVEPPLAPFFDLRDGRWHDRAHTLDPFLVRGRLAGFLARVLEGELGNVTAGAAFQTPVLIGRG